MAGINWVHVGFVAPMLSYIVWENSHKRVLSENMLTIWSIIIVVMVIFHLIRGISDLMKPQNP